MDLSTIIVNYHSSRLLRNCLRSMEENLAGSGLSYEFIVVDNSPADGLREQLAIWFPAAKYLTHGGNAGYAKAVNLGLKNSQGRYLAVFNPDIVVLQPGALAALCRFLDEHPKAGLVGPKLLNPDHSLQFTCKRFPNWYTPALRRLPLLRRSELAQRHLRSFQMEDWDHASDRTVDWVIGTGLVVRRAAYGQVGGMDGRFFMFYEDTDWCRRFWEKGWKVWYAAGVEVIHYYGRPSDDVSLWRALFKRMTWVHIMSGLRYIGKYLGKPLPDVSSGD